MNRRQAEPLDPQPGIDHLAHDAHVLPQFQGTRRDADRTAIGQRLGKPVDDATTAVKFEKPGIYYYICTPHPWMYGQVIVE